MTKHKNIPILEVAVLEMGRLRKGEPFLSSEILKWIYPEAWENFIPELVIEIMRMENEGKILVQRKSSPLGVSPKNEEEFIISVII